MKASHLWLVSVLAWPVASFAQGGIAALADCNDQTIGYMQTLIADRLDAKLAQSPALTAEEREIWQRDVRALRAVTRATPRYQAPDAADAQHYLLGLSDDEQKAINSMQIRRVQDVQIECELKHGGLDRRPTESHPYIVSLRSQLVTPTDISTVTVGALPSPTRKTREQLAAEERAAREQATAAQQAAARQALTQSAAGAQGIANKAVVCQQEAQGLQMTMQADLMQTKLDGTTGLSAKERADFEADIGAVRAAAAANQPMPAPVDPANPMRAFTRLTQAEQMTLINEFSTRVSQQIQACMAR